MSGNVQVDVKTRFVADTQQLDSQINSSMVKAAKSGAITDSGLASVPGEKAQNGLISFNESLTSLTETMSQVLSSFKAFSENLKKFTGQGGTGNGGLPGTPDVSGDNNIFKNGGAVQKGLNGLIGTAGMGLSFYQGYNAQQRQLMHGNWIDAQATGVSTTANALTGVGSAMTMFGMSTGLLPVALLGGLFSLGGLGAKAYGSKLEKDNDAYRMFSENYGLLDQLLVASGNAAGGKTGEENLSSAVDTYANILKKNNGLGLTDSDFGQMVASTRKYGYKFDEGSDAVVNAATIARNTNGDANSILALMGMITRSGGNGNTVAAMYNNKALLGVNDTQFDELLRGIEGAIEKGTSKGYTANVTGIMTTLSALYNASGTSSKSFWSGEQGLQKLQSMGNALSNAKDLNSVNDVMMYQAVSSSMSDEDLKKALGDSYVSGDRLTNIRTYMDRGEISLDVLNAYRNKVISNFGSAGSVQLFSQAGLSLDSAAQLYNMNGKSLYDNYEEGSTVVSSPFQSGSSLEQDIENSMTRASTLDKNQINRINEQDLKLKNANKKASNFVYSGYFDENVLTYEQMLYEGGETGNANEKNAKAIMQAAYSKSDVSQETFDKMLQLIANTINGGEYSRKNGGYTFDDAQLKKFVDAFEFMLNGTEFKLVDY